MRRLSYLLSVVVFSALAACADVPAGVSTEPRATPLEEKDFGELTTHSELEAFVERLGEESDRIHVETLGTSVEGRRIPLLKISIGSFGADENKLRMLVFAQQHGNEPSGKEAALMLARDFAAGVHDDLLEEMDILLVPQVNPDGSERHRRRNADDVDLNRSHLILNAPETLALHALFHEWLPEVTLDVHEYQPWVGSWIQHGYIRLFDEQYGVSTNVNTAASLRALAEEEFLPYAEEQLAEQGFSFHNYLVGSPDYIRYSTTNINDGRQSFGLLNTFSFILEGKRPRGEDEATAMERRAAGQLAAIEALLSFSAENKDRVQGLVRQEREALRQGTEGELALTMDREPGDGPLTIPTQALEQANGNVALGDTIMVDIEAYYPRIVPHETVEIPDAYVVPASEEAVIEILRQHRVEMAELQEGEELQVDRYVIDGFEMLDLSDASYRLPVVTAEATAYAVQEGDVLVPTTQLARNWIATALEPRSKHGLLQYSQFEHLGESPAYPILRIVER